MAINLASKYADKIAAAFTLKSVVDGTTNKDYDFTGVKTLSINTPTTQALTDYQRTGLQRYGVPQEMQDTVQELVLSRDRAFSITIDKGNNMEQMNVKEAGRMLSLELEEQVVPEMDKYALEKFIDYAGTVTSLSAAPTKDTIVAALSDGMVALSNKKVPKENRSIFISWSTFGNLR